MGLTISTNIAAMNSMRHINDSLSEQAKTYERLSSGQRIVQASDDVSGLSISENMKYQNRAYQQAKRNAADAISFTQTAEGAMSEMGNILIRLRELGTQAASDAIGDNERKYIHNEAQGLIEEINRIAEVTQFNETPLLNGKASKDTLQFQVGIHDDEASRMSFNMSDIDSTASNLGLDGVNFETSSHASNSFEKIDKAVKKLTGNRANLAGIQNNLNSTIANLEITTENLASARSQIADADLAEETSKLVKGNILQSAGISVLAQANQTPAQALKLL